MEKNIEDITLTHHAHLLAPSRDRFFVTSRRGIRQLPDCNPPWRLSVTEEKSSWRRVVTEVRTGAFGSMVSHISFLMR
jgi:hypothetical protein